MEKANRGPNTDPGDESGFDELTKKGLIEVVKSAGEGLSEQAMEVMGYICSVKDGWVVNIYKDGRVERIVKLAD